MKYYRFNNCYECYYDLYSQSIMAQSIMGAYYIIQTKYK